MTMDAENSDGDGGDQVLVAEFALGLLGASEHEAMAARIAKEPLLAADLALWRRRLSSLDNEFVETSAPPNVFPAIERRLFGSAAGSAPGVMAWWNNLNLWRGLAAGGLAIAVLSIGFNVLVPRAPLTGKELVAALEQQGSGVSFVAFYDQSSGKVRLAALSGAAVPQKDFELWAIEGKNAPISMGVIPVNARSQVTVSDQIKKNFGAGTVLAVTLEPKGGSPTGKPTGPIVAKGAAISI